MKIKGSMDRVEALLAARRWESVCLRTSIASPELLVRQNGFVKARVDSNVLRKGETELREAIRAIAPGWYEDVKIVLNRNVTCKPHTDAANRGHSYILFLGGFTGGALVFEDGARVEEAWRWHCINGRVRHWNEPHQGTKYSIVLYRPTVSSKSAIIHARRCEKKNE